MKKLIQAKNFTLFLFKQAKGELIDGADRFVSDVEMLRRSSICGVCDDAKLDEQEELLCSTCLCPLKDKILYTYSECPKKKWLAVEGYND